MWSAAGATSRRHGRTSVSITFCVLFLVAFGQSTFENWRSAFLQLFAFVVLSAVLIHRGSAESKDSDDRMEHQLKDINKKLDELSSSVSSARH